MVKIPKKTKRYCPKCKKHTEHKVKQAKTRPRPKTRKRALSWGVRHMAKVLAGHGGFPRPKPHGKDKTSQKLNLQYECPVCNYKHFKQNPKRAKRVEQKT